MKKNNSSFFVKPAIFGIIGFVTSMLLIIFLPLLALGGFWILFLFVAFWPYLLGISLMVGVATFLIILNKLTAGKTTYKKLHNKTQMLIIVFGTIFLFFVIYATIRENSQIRKNIAVDQVPSDWLTYNSEELGVSFKYPSSFEKADIDNPKLIRVFRDETQAYPKKVQIDIEQVEKTVRLKNKETDKKTYISTTITSKDSAYEVTLFVIGGELSTYEEIYENILSSIKFTEANSIDLEASWVISTEKDGFTYQKPRAWISSTNELFSGSEYQEYDTIISDREYKIIIDRPSFYEYKTCLNSKETDTSDLNPFQIALDGFTNINETYIRPTNPEISEAKNIAVWQICKHDPGKGIITTTYTYETPVEYNSSQIEIMDKIIDSFEFKNEEK